MSPRSWRIAGFIFGLLAGVAAIGMGFWVHGVAGYRLGDTWVLVGFTLSAPRLLVAMGALMIVGAIVLIWSDVAGGIIVGGAVCVGLVWCFYHVDHRVANLKMWSSATVLGFLAAMCAGISLGGRTEGVGLPAVPAPEPSPESEPETVQV